MALVTREVLISGPDGTMTWQQVQIELPDEQVLAEANEATIRARAELALDSNAAFLDLGAPTNAEALAQIKRLTRECNGLIRLVLRQLDTTEGTA
jgi:hypothetical protein